MINVEVHLMWSQTGGRSGRCLQPTIGCRALQAPERPGLCPRQLYLSKTMIRLRAGIKLKHAHPFGRGYVTLTRISDPLNSYRCADLDSDGMEFVRKGCQGMHPLVFLQFGEPPLSHIHMSKLFGKQVSKPVDNKSKHAKRETQTSSFKSNTSDHGHPPCV